MVLGAAIAVILLSANAHCVGSRDASPLAATPPLGRRLPTPIPSVDGGRRRYHISLKCHGIDYGDWSDHTDRFHISMILKEWYSTSWRYPSWGALVTRRTGCMVANGAGCVSTGWIGRTDVDAGYWFGPCEGWAWQGAGRITEGGLLAAWRIERWWIGSYDSAGSWLGHV